jgi:thiol-disulfide isomerase/thioredoxin|tara:strand:- start:2125 stop:2697 length:573 start_codon:yes stop_codon:yes gene_type:complete
MSGNSSDFSNQLKTHLSNVSNNTIKTVNGITGTITENIGKPRIDWLKQHKIMIFSILLITIFFIVISKWCYNKYVLPVLDREYLPNKEFIGKDINNKLNVYFFYTNWCPYCKKARPEWNKFIKDVENHKLLVQNFDVNFIEVDAEKDTHLAKEFKIDAYPSIKIEKNGNIYNYDAKPDSKHLMEFFKGSL